MLRKSIYLFIGNKFIYKYDFHRKITSFFEFSLQKDFKLANIYFELYELGIAWDNFLLILFLLKILVTNSIHMLEHE